MNILIVKAHPSKHGHAHQIADTYAEAKRAQQHEVKIVDLYDPSNKEEFLAFENIREMTPPKEQIEFEKQVAWANEIVVVFPIWWGMPPAIMMNWVDLTFWAHFAYKFNPDGSMQPLLKGKTGKVFATSGGPSWFYYFPILPLKQYWGLTLFRSVGIELIDFKVCGYLDKWKGEKVEKHFQNFLQKVKASAQNIK
jgi:NAD(P)H dehydrogenase (quinone)